MRARTVSTILAMALLFLAGNAQAQKKEQRFIIGFGLGKHQYDDTDAARANKLTNPDQSAPAFDLYFEWYPATRLGIGLRAMESLEAHSQAQPSGYTLHTVADTGTLAVTLNLIPWISDSGYSRFGFIAGVGRTGYAFNASLEGPDGYSVQSDSWSTSGPSQLYQIYLDWGGDVFGARIGIGKLKTDLDPLNDGTNFYDADASGNQFLLEFRWAIP